MKITRRIGISLFLAVAGVYALTLNSWNADFFGLQSATVAALVERGTFALVDQVIPGFNLVEGDETFRYGDKVYPMKQPGQTVAGALFYAPLHAAGIHFTNHYHNAVHFITFFTSVLIMAATAALIYLAGTLFTKDRFLMLLPPLIFAFCTIIWPYAGVLHHDIHATFFAFAGVFFYLYYLYRSPRPLYVFFSGVSVGLTLFFSMLPVTLPFALGILILLRRNLREITYYAAGVFAGLLPSFIFNYTQFGNPLSFPNLAGKVADTVPFWSLPNFMNHLHFYLISVKHSLFLFSPVLLFAAAGIFAIPAAFRHLRALLIVIPLAQLIHISTQETYGGYQYGPRYLLTIIPLLCLGLVFVWGRLSLHFKAIFVLTSVYSFAVSLIGSLSTVMYPTDSIYAPWGSLTYMLEGNMPDFRFVPVGIMILTLTVLYLHVSRRRS